MNRREQLTVKTDVIEAQAMAQALAQGEDATAGLGRFFDGKLAVAVDILKRDDSAKALTVWEDYGDEECSDSYTEYRIYPASMTRDEIRADYQSPDGTGRCECTHCLNGWDCCGNWSAGAVEFPNVRIGSGILVQQNWICNV